ncbi:MAG: CPBP family intramembrane metalloprotease [Gemmatimonadetes bacterium]|nr:CPBP family intramembrane metalloprotease [Gemmatimonadota bacterium]
MAIESLFRTDGGAVRALWRVVLFLCAIGVASFLVVGLGYGILLLTPAVRWARELRIPLAQVASVVSVLLATLFALRVLHPNEPSVWRHAALDRRAWRWRPALASGLLGATCVVVPAGLLLAVGFLRVEAAPPGSAVTAIWAATALLLPAAFAEELIFRGYLQSVLREPLGDRASIGILSIAFGLVHLGNPDPSVASIVAVTVAGVFLGVIRHVTGSLVAATAAHFTVNFAQVSIVHAPVSGLAIPAPRYRVVSDGPAWLTGGSWGPEAGAATVLTLLIATFLLWRGAQLTVARAAAHTEPNAGPTAGLNA